MSGPGGFGADDGADKNSALVGHEVRGAVGAVVHLPRFNPQPGRRLGRLAGVAAKSVGLGSDGCVGKGFAVLVLFQQGLQFMHVLKFFVQKTRKSLGRM